MKTDTRSIMLISDDADIRKAVSDALSDYKDVALKIQGGTLTSVNGAAVKMVDQHSLIVFRLKENTDRDSVMALREKAGGRGTLLALSDGSISLADAMELKDIGIDEVLPFPISQQQLSKQLLALSGYRTQLPALLGSHGAPRLGHVIAVCPVRGGIGASTVAINLADSLQDKTGLGRRQARHKVVLVDLDLQFGTLASALDLEASDTLFRMAGDGHVPDATFLAQALQRHPSGLDVLTAPDRFAPIDALQRAQIDALVGNLQRAYDYVVIDLPRSLVDWMGPVLARCHKLMMVTDTTVPSIRQAHRLLEFYTEERLDLPAEIVVNHERRPMFLARHHAEAQKVLERPLMHWLPDDPKPARLALDRGELLSKAAGSSALAKSIRKMARRLLDEPAASDRPARTTA